MGEYALRKSDRTEIKIGTCEGMYYLRFEDRDKVLPVPNSVDVRRDEVAGKLLFRLPFPDEDTILPGDYEDDTRGQRLYRASEVGGCCTDFTDPSTAEKPGIMQLKHKESGLLLNVPCHHGHRLPDVGPGCQAFWNGKGHSLELYMLRAVYKDGRLKLYPVVHCRHCRAAWRYDWADVIEFIPQPLRGRLEVYAKKS